MRRAVARLKSKVKPDTVVMLFFGGYGVQVGRESYMIPVDAKIWKEADVRRDGVSVESVLDAIKEKGARAKLVVVDASRRNPYERRFRAFSHGLAPITAPDNALILTSATPGKVADNSKGSHSVLMTELLTQLNSACWPASSPSSTRPASPSPAPPTATRCPRCRPRCWKTSASRRRATKPAAKTLSSSLRTQGPIRRGPSAQAQWSTAFLNYQHL